MRALACRIGSAARSRTAPDPGTLEAWELKPSTQFVVQPAVSADVLLLLGPPLTLLVDVAAACLWLCVGEGPRRRRRDELLAALRVAEGEMGPPPDGVGLGPPRSSSHRTGTRHSPPERSVA
jgi:hypothetical protein